MDFKLKTSPWLTKQSIQFLDKFLNEAPRKVLELGSGASTIWFAQRTQDLTSFEHDLRWYDVVNKELDKQNLKVDYHLFNGSYAKELKNLPTNYFDLILVDGKDRIECIKNSIALLKSGGILMLDDAQRKHYAVVNELLKDWQFFTTEDYDEEKKHNFETNWWVKL